MQGRLEFIVSLEVFPTKLREVEDGYVL